MLSARANADGVVVPLPEAVTEQADPIAPEVPAPDAVAAPADTEADSPVVTVADVPTLVRFTPPAVSAVVPTPDSYSLRLVTGRRMYDHGTTTQASSSLRKLAADGGVHLNPGEIERHGLHNGSSVTVTSQNNDVVMTVVADPQGAAGHRAHALWLRRCRRSVADRPWHHRRRGCHQDPTGDAEGR